MVATSNHKSRPSQIKGQSLGSVPSRLSSAETSARSARYGPRSSPYLPTSLESLLLSIYPATLIIGSLFSLIDPAARNSPYNLTTQSHPPNEAPSYFAKKSNIFNKFFVKRGWAWITASFIYFLFSHPSIGPSTSLCLTTKRLQGLLRYGLVTLWWIFVTQWFFGPPIIDRGFIMTGGRCELIQSRIKGHKVLVTATACKAQGGHWKDGHDISGHVFLLVLGSMFLFEEVLHVALTRHQEERTITMKDGAIKNARLDSDETLLSGPVGRWTSGSKIAVGVATMCLYMLLMTAAYFHTWFEKLTGLGFALAGIFMVYFLPRAVPGLRTFVAMPGI